MDGVFQCGMNLGPVRDDKWISGLDGLRALAIVPVILIHGAIATGFEPTMAPEPFSTLISLGWMGVDLFFAISGFLITTILLRDGLSIRGFYVRRALRILPPFLLAMCLWFIAFPLVPNVTCVKPLAAVLACDPRILPSLATFTLNYVVPPEIVVHCAGIGALVAWSLCIEEHFYLVYPWLLRACRSRRAQLAVLSAIVLVSPVARFVAFSMSSEGAALKYLTHLRLDALAVGCIAAILWASVPEAQTRFPRRAVLVVAGLVAVAFAVDGHFSEAHMTRGSFSLGYTAISLFFAALILETASLQTWLTHMLDARALRAIGRVSYGMYLLHFPVVEASFPWLANVRVKSLPAHFALSSAVFVIATFLVASTVYWVWERPFLNLRSRFR